MRKRIRILGKRGLLAVAAVVAVSAFSVLLAACGEDEEPSTLTITATEFAFKMAGEDLKPGPIRIVMPNEGQYEHHAQFFRLEGGHTLDELMQAAAALGEESVALPDWAVWMGGPGLLSAGQTAETIADFPAGHYAFICFLEEPDGVPHAAKGMLGEFTLSGEKNTAELPAADFTITGEDDGTGKSYSFGLPASVKAGEAVMEFKNAGSEPHEMQVARVPGNLTLEQVLGVFFEQTAPPEGFEYVALGGPQAIEPGDSTRARINFEAGRYILICFIPSPEGAPHAALGMAAQLDVP